MKDVRDTVSEHSTTSLIFQQILEHDTAILTAFHDGHTEEENLGYNRVLNAFLLTQRYGVSPIDGAYVGDLNAGAAEGVEDHSLFVVNLEDTTGFYIDLFKLGEYYCQNSILCIPKGGKGAFLKGANDTGFPGYKNIASVGDFHPRDDSETGAKHKDKPFYLETILTVADDRASRLPMYDICRELRIYTEHTGMFIRITAAPNPDFIPGSPEATMKRYHINTAVKDVEDAIRVAAAFKAKRKPAPGNWSKADVLKDGRMIGHVSYDCIFHERKRKQRISDQEKVEDAHVPK